MKKDKEWLKESINELKTIFNGRKMSGYVAGMLDGYNHASMLIDHLDEPEKPVIPKFVADYIEQSKKDNDSINQVFAFMDDKEDKDLWHWLFPSMYEEKRANQEVFMRAWLDGYEVEKEKKYRVVFPYKWETVYLREGAHGDFDVIETETYGTQYTEAEIKAIDERYWAFAEEVTE